MKVSRIWERCILGVYGFGKGISHDRSAWYVADAKSVWSWRNIVKSSAGFFMQIGLCVLVGNDVSGWFSVSVGLSQGWVCLHGCLMYIRRTNFVST